MIAASDPEKNRSILAALQLGWLAVEAFGLLRRYGHHGKPLSVSKTTPNQRFNFTERKPNLYEQTLIALQQLKAIGDQLPPDLQPPVPDEPASLLKDAKEDLEPLWERFEDWSRRTWNYLQVSNPQAGQAFACGGDLVDTFWYPQGTGANKLVEMLRSYRLEYIAERIGGLSGDLPEQAAQAICYSLKQWSIGERVENLDEKQQKLLLKRLEAQTKVWRDLLFGLRGANSYLTPYHRRQIARRAVVETAILVLLVGIGVWLAVLLLAGLGRSLMGSAMDLPLDVSTISSDLVAYIANWQNWSSLLATGSSVVVMLTGLTNRLSGWLWAFYAKRKQTLTLERINRRTYRDHNLRKREEPESETTDL